MNNDRRSRLAGHDAVQFWSIISEMKIGVWLSRQGVHFRAFEPPMAGGGKGDYLVEKGENLVFIKIKTLFGGGYLLDQNRLTADLAQYCIRKQLLVECVNLTQYPRGYAYDKKRNDLFEDIRKTVIPSLPLLDKRTVKYSDKEGVSIEMSLAPGASRVVSRMYGGFSNVREDLRIRLGMRDTPGQRALQVAYGETPSVFVINDFGSNIEPVLIEDVLYGTLVEDYTQGSSPVYYRR